MTNTDQLRIRIEDLEKGMLHQGNTLRGESSFVVDLQKRVQILEGIVFNLKNRPAKHGVFWTFWK